MVTLRQYMTLVQAERDKSLLDAAGIPAFVAGENSASAGYGNVIGELRLQVQEADVERARRVLDEHEGFAPLPDDFIPPEEPPQAKSGLEHMETDNKNVVLSVVVTLILVLAIIAAFNSSKTSTNRVSERDRQQYEERVRRAEALMTSQEQVHQRYLAFLAKAEEDQRRFETILATWERQQQEYQKHLDGLQKKP